MQKAKKVFRRLCLTNWGGIDHTILEFNEYVNLFSGKSGSGKSTAMDALQVILYGSVSSNFLNRAADDNKNKRSVFGYLRGEQKDGTANRDGMDFCTVIALEIEDTGTHHSNCIGLAFEVRKTDNELKKFLYFSHSGKMPEHGYLTEEGIPFSNTQIRKLVESRENSHENRGRGEVNRIYNSKEAYLHNLYHTLLGYIDGNRFTTMEKSAIALRMTDGTGQFIKDYMFPKGTGDAIEKLSQQLGSYRDICERIEDMKRRIELLKAVQEAGLKLSSARAEEMQNVNLLKCLDIEDAKDHIAGWTSQQQDVNEKIASAKDKIEALQGQEDLVNEEWTKAKADLQSSDLGRKKEHLEELSKRSEMLAANTRRWRSVTEGLKRWGEDEIIGDYISQFLLKNIDKFVENPVTTQQCMDLREQIASEKKQLEEELRFLREEFTEVRKKREEKRTFVEDMKNNRKSYGEQLRKARAALEERLQYTYGKQAKVFIFADLFDVQDAEWKNAVEARLGKLRFAMITEPQYALEAAKQFRKLTRYEHVDLINSETLMQSEPKVKEHSLYETVYSEKDYVDACLKRFLGAIIKCETEEELVQAGNGVTKDCYSYHNFMFRHLRKKDYEVAFIGTKVSKAKLSQYEQELEKLESQYNRFVEQIAHMEQIYNYEMLKENEEDYVALSKSGNELEDTINEMEELRTTIATLEKGEYKELQEKEKQLHEQYSQLRKESRKCSGQLQDMERQLGELNSNIYGKQKYLEELLLGYVENANIKEQIKLEREHHSFYSLKKKYEQGISDAKECAETAMEERSHARDFYINAYPNCEFTGLEKTNERYDAKLLEYQQNYEPQYQEEFEQQCKLIYKSLRDNVIAKIHGDIKAAHRHKKEINRLLRETNFADSRYQIDIEAAQNADGQFYEMLMAEELDTKKSGRRFIFPEVRFANKSINGEVYASQKCR